MANIQIHQTSGNSVVHINHWKKKLVSQKNVGINKKLNGHNNHQNIIGKMLRSVRKIQIIFGNCKRNVWLAYFYK